MARQLSRNPHVDPFIPEPPRLGGLTKDQEREVADLLEKGFGLNPKYGIKGNLATGAIFGAVKKIHGMSDKEWAEMLRGLPHYGDFQDQDIDAIQEHFLNKYPVGPLLKLPVPQEFKLFDRSTWPNNWETLGETYGIDAGVLPSDAAYQKIMSISPDALSGVKATGLDSYEGPIAETIEWKDVPKMAQGGLINGTRGNMAIVGDAGPELVKVNNGEAEVIPLSNTTKPMSWAYQSGVASPGFPWEDLPSSSEPSMEFGEDVDGRFGVSQRYSPNIWDGESHGAMMPQLEHTFFHYTPSDKLLHDTGSTFRLEQKTIDKMPGKKEPPYGNKALLQKDALDAYNRLQNMFWDKYKKPIPLESAFRNLDHNEALIKRGLGASETSKHMEGLAIDVSRSRLTPEEWEFLRDNAVRSGFRWDDYKPGSNHFNYIPEWDAIAT